MWERPRVTAPAVQAGGPGRVIIQQSVFSRHHRKVKILFALADVFLVTLAFLAAYEGRYWLPFERTFFLSAPVKALLLIACAIAWPLIGFWFGVYERPDSAQPRVILRDAFKQSALGVTSIILLQYSLRLDLSRGFLALLGVSSWLLLCLFRSHAGAVIGWTRRKFGATQNILIVGLGERGQKLARSLERSGAHGINLAGFLDPDGTGAEPRECQGRPVYGLDRLPTLLERQVIDEVIFAVDSDRLARLEEVFLLCDEVGVRTRLVLDFFPHVNSDVYLDRFESTPLLTFAAAPHDEITLFAKRVIDVILAGAALVLLAPLMAGVALVIRLTSPGPAIFQQVRCGLNGRRFTFYKFRSMVENAEEMKESLQHLNRKEVAFKIPDDPRLTRVGRYLRRYSIDEWPQLWNVLRGDMSLVGPRPAVPEEVEQYKRWQRRRMRMRPGLTCLWALEGRDGLDFETWMKKDMEYIDNWSLGLDWKIIMRTIPRVLSGKGAH